MENINVLFERKLEVKYEFVEGISWLLKFGFLPQCLSLDLFKGEYKNKKYEGEKFQMTAEWSNEKGWKVELGESQSHLQLAVKDGVKKGPVPSFEDKVLKDAILAMFRFIDEANARGDLFIRPYRKDDLL